MVDTADLGSAEYIRAGSSPVSHTCGFTALGTIPLEKAKQKRIRQHEARQEAKRKANAEREEKIRIQVEAYKRAIKEISNDFTKDSNNSLDDALVNLRKNGFMQ